MVMREALLHIVGTALPPAGLRTVSAASRRAGTRPWSLGSKKSADLMALLWSE